MNDQKSAASAQAIVQRAARAGELGDVLDVGCGTGTVLSAAASAHAHSLAGVDTDAAFLALARRALPDASIAEADVQTHLPFADSSFDTVFFCDVIEHLFRPVEALAEIRRVLRVGGRMVLTTPNGNALMRRLAGDRWYALRDPSHAIFYTRFSLAHLLRFCGFDVERVDRLPLTGSVPADLVMGTIREGGTLCALARSRGATAPLPTPPRAPT